VSSLTDNENERIAKKIIQAYNDKNLESWLSYFAEDSIVIWPDDVKPSLDELREEFIEIADAIPDRKFTVDRIVSRGNTVLIELVVSGTQKGELFGMPASNKSFEMPMAQVIDIEKGKVNRYRFYANYQTLLQQLSD